MKDDGGAAYPAVMSPYESNTVTRGMSLRDWFAGQALTVFSSDVDNWSRMARDYKENLEDMQARLAYRLADAMLAERNKGERE